MSLPETCLSASTAVSRGRRPSKPNPGFGVFFGEGDEMSDLTPKMREALAVWDRRDRRYTAGVVNAHETALIDGQPWIHFRTADGLRRHGLATVTGEGEECEIVIPDLDADRTRPSAADSSQPNPAKPNNQEAVDG